MKGSSEKGLSEAVLDEKMERQGRGSVKCTSKYMRTAKAESFHFIAKRDFFRGSEKKSGLKQWQHDDLNPPSRQT